jgi:hypothetical protein
MTPQEYDYWMQTKTAYETNLKNNYGHKASIETLLEKIERKLSNAIVVGVK